MAICKGPCLLFWSWSWVLSLGGIVIHTISACNEYLTTTAVGLLSLAKSVVFECYCYDIFLFRKKKSLEMSVWNKEIFQFLWAKVYPQSSVHRWLLCLAPKSQREQIHQSWWLSKEGKERYSLFYHVFILLIFFLILSTFYQTLAIVNM